MLHEQPTEDITEKWSFETSSTCELVVILRGFTYEDELSIDISHRFHERNHHERPKASGDWAMYEFYNML
jgi:hypothetical protein